MIRYIKLEGKELEPVLLKIEEMTQVKPDALVGFVAVDDENNVKAEIVIQMVCLAEPAIAEPGYGHCLGPLFAEAYKFIQDSEIKRVVMHTEHRAMERMLDRAKARPWTVKMWQLLRGK